MILYSENREKGWFYEWSRVALNRLLRRSQNAGLAPVRGGDGAFKGSLKAIMVSSDESSLSLLVVLATMVSTSRQ